MQTYFFWKKLCVISTLLLLAGSLSSYAAEQAGVVRTGSIPIRFSSVTLYSTGSTQGESSVILGTAQTNREGSFSIAFTRPANENTILYLVADGGIPATSLRSNHSPGESIRLAAVLGRLPVAPAVVINERTTIAAAYALAQFISGSNIGGKSPGLQNAADTVLNLVNPITGEVGTVLGNPPNGLRTSTMREFNSLANLLATCVDSITPLPCRSLFALATPPGRIEPHDTFQAAVNIAHNPWLNPRQLFLQSRLRGHYRPFLSRAPDAWTLAIVYQGNGHEFDGPGNMAFDKDGNIWITNNYEYSRSPFTCVYGGRQLLKLTPSGLDAVGAPYTGGGLYGAGFGITLDPQGNVWAGNFGFEGTSNGVSCNPNPPKTNVSVFSSNGAPLSPPHGFTQGNINKPQATVSDRHGNIWIANCGNDSVTQYPGGNPALSKNFRDIGLLRPFGMAVDAAGNAWIGSSGNDSVIGLDPHGHAIGSPIAVGVAPLGVAVDSLGNIWTANSGAVKLPCTDQGGYFPQPPRPQSQKLIAPAGVRARFLLSVVG